MVKSLPAMQETWIGSLGWEYPLEKEMTTYSSILAWKIPRTEEPGRFKSTGPRRVRHDRATNTFTFDLSGGSVAKTRCFHCRDTSSSPIPHTAQCGQKKKYRLFGPIPDLQNEILLVRNQRSGFNKHPGDSNVH